MKDNFLDSDHDVSLDAVINVINTEIQWCYQHTMTGLVSKKYRKGFIKGLKQAKYLIVEWAKYRYEDK